MTSRDTASTIPDGERAAAAIAIQNTMSRHEYLHAAGENLQDLELNWVSQTGAFAPTATFGSPQWVMVGMDSIRAAYGEGRRGGMAKGLEDLSAIDPTVSNTPENFGAGAEWVMHTSTTPIIEVADDGRSAQGVWYSPGISVLPVFQEGKIHLRSVWFHEKYGGDFVKEDGRWRIWHLQMAYDFIPDLPQELLASLTGQLGDLALRRPLQAEPLLKKIEMPGIVEPDYVYPPYSPRRAAVIWPKLPVPYRTWGDSGYSNANTALDYPDF